MSMVNHNFSRLAGSYLFARMKDELDRFKSAHPEVDVIRLGIGDVTRPLVPSVISALHRAADEMGAPAAFRGYGPEQGYQFLREAAVRREYAPYGADISPDEVFISDGAKCDVGNIQELFSTDARVAICDPVYPVYLDSNVMAGRLDNVVYLPCRESNGFAPEFPAGKVDVIYLCSPNNPTGAVLDRAMLTRWVDYARTTGAVLLYDSAYSAYIRDPGIPHTIYEIPGAREVAIEFKSFSKTAGFTGLRCAFAVVPKSLERDGVNLNQLWFRRQCTKFNGVAYIVQRAAEAVYSDAGWREVNAVIDYYMENAEIIRTGLEKNGFTVYGGKNAPYIWWKLPHGADSFGFAKTLLEKTGIVGTPGVGFGSCGEGYFRLTAFGEKSRTVEAVRRIAEAKF
ncbi:MAG: LL-diaminopimelate aminotransferase [Victivallaceae bacterium]|nr:LL-diaminopimelate aminotransferase [Victivallaceae bacterium]